VFVTQLGRSINAGCGATVGANRPRNWDVVEMVGVTTGRLQARSRTQNEASCNDAGVGWRIEFHQPGNFTGRDQSAAAEVHSP
jgi:hypothetical protein